ncbi:MAG: VCBS repeat-containing protein, partial [Gemmatimonadetes bacterium]
MNARVRWVRVCSAVAAALVVGCGEARLPEWQQEGPGVRWRDLRPAERRTAGFTALDPGRAGLLFENTLPDSLQAENRILGHGSGVAFADVDGDGWTDVYLTAIDGPNHLFRNRGGWRFEDVTERAGVALAGRRSSGAAFADVDGDGDPDLLVA